MVVVVVVVDTVHNAHCVEERVHFFTKKTPPPISFPAYGPVSHRPTLNSSSEMSTGS